MRKLLWFFVVMVGLGSYSCYAADKIVCVVNGDVITDRELKEFENVLRFKISMQYKDKDKAYEVFEEERKNALEKMIEDRLIINAAQEKKYELPESFIEKRIEEFRSQFPSDEAFHKSLVARGINLKLLKEKVANQILMKQVVNDEVRSKVNIKPYQITDYYTKNSDSFVYDAQIKYRAIVLEDDAKAKAAYAGLSQAEDVEKVFDLYKDDVSSGTLNEKDVMDDLKVLFSDKVKKVFEPILLADSHYVFFVDERIAAQQAPLDEVHTEIMNELFQQRFSELFGEWIEKLKEDAIIKIMSD